MLYKRKNLITAILLIISIQFLIYYSNTQKSTFKFFIWNTQEIELGKLISISFISGFIISIALNNNIITKEIYSSKENEISNEDNNSLNNYEDDYTNIEMPPQRDVRETQPTISVNYRVIKNTEDRFSQDNNNSLNNEKYIDDWNNNENDW